MKRPMVALIATASLVGCTSEKEKEDKGGETFEKMVILEEDPSSIENPTDRRYEIR